MNYDEALSHCIFRFVSGSKAYGTDRPDSDTDYRGVFIAPLSSAFDLFQSSFIGSGTPGDHLRAAIHSIDALDVDDARWQITEAMNPEYGDLNMGVGTVHKTGVDEELQELRKFFKLAAESNPNIIEFLYCEKGIELSTPVWERIRASRGMFLSKKARFTFSGYAVSQLRRIETHRSYLLHPPGSKPARADFGLPEGTTFAKEHQCAILSLPDELIAQNARELVKKEKSYHAKMAEWNAYRKWETERNPARKALEAKYGFDAKHAMHLVRLCRMAVEILRDGKVLVHRPDAEELKGVLRGEWSYERVVAEALGIDKILDPLYQASTLRKTPDYKGISNLYRSICEEHYGIKIGS